MLRTSGIAVALSGCLLLLTGTSSDAGILNGHVDALPGWSGTVAFDNGMGLKGDLDYAVFLAADFNANFAGLGYTPTNAVVYTYQIINAGAPTDSISAEIVGIANAAETIGTFDIGDVNASSAAFVLGDAQWLFNPEIGPGESSWGLAFSSPNAPMNGLATTVDGGGEVLLVVPTPSDIPIPEPSTLVLLSLGGSLLLLRRRQS